MAQPQDPLCRMSDSFQSLSRPIILLMFGIRKVLRIRLPADGPLGPLASQSCPRLVSTPQRQHLLLPITRLNGFILQFKFYYVFESLLIMNGGRSPRLILPRQNTRRPLRACAECYRRKLKCNRNQPCSNCVRGSVACLYTDEPIRRDRKSKCRDSKLAERVADLERLLGSRDDQSSVRNLPAEAEDSADDESRRFQQRPGRLLVNEPGKSRFVMKTFWAELPAKVCLPPRWK